MWPRETCHGPLDGKKRCKTCKHKRYLCINNQCRSCACTDNKCLMHYRKCRLCPGRIERKKCSRCKDCCHNTRCNYHFIQEGNVTAELLNFCKIVLYSKHLPADIVNKIVDEHLDVREKCKTCHIKFSSLNSCISSYAAFKCGIRFLYVCDKCDGENWLCDDESYLCRGCY